MELTQQDLCTRFKASLSTVRRMVRHAAKTIEPRWLFGRPLFSPEQADVIKAAWEERAAKTAKSRSRKVKAIWRERRRNGNGNGHAVLTVAEVKRRAGR
jgi:hypothetical protein